MKTHRYAGALLVAGFLAAWACNSDNDNPTGPSPTPAPPPVSDIAPPAPTPAPTPPAPDRTEGTPAKARYSAHVITNVGTWGVTIEHLGGWTDERVGVACYENPDRTTGENQTFSDGRAVSINSNASQTLGATIPECVPWQCDAFEGDPILGSGDIRYGRRLILGRSGGPQGDCSRKPPCPNPPCTPPVCDSETLEARAKAACEHGVESIDFESCSWTCKPPPQCDVEALEAKAKRTAAAACEHGVEDIFLDVKACTFDFTCKPPPVCDVEALEDKLAKLKAVCTAEGGIFNGAINVEACKVRSECKPPPDECVEIGTGGPFPKQGNPADECAFFGDFVPTRGSADFYICKAGTEMFTSTSPFGATCPNGKDKSHETKCVCDGDDDSSDCS